LIISRSRLTFYHGEPTTARFSSTRCADAIGIMNRVILIILAAAALAACGNVTIGPVDTSCHTPGRISVGSGCETPH
jgi:hypothetical protein